MAPLEVAPVPAPIDLEMEKPKKSRAASPAPRKDKEESEGELKPWKESGKDVKAKSTDSKQAAEEPKEKPAQKTGHFRLLCAGIVSSLLCLTAVMFMVPFTSIQDLALRGVVDLKVPCLVVVVLGALAISTWFAVKQVRKYRAKKAV
ncbi:SPAC4G8.04 [Symbiodinium sp. CCMP2456]|nr:SPAC4G8.04 [Symbiodinium sp. CCMP2456]